MSKNSAMQVSARLKKAVQQELVMNPSQTNSEIMVLLGVSEKDVQAIREEMAKRDLPEPEKEKKDLPEPEKEEPTEPKKEYRKVAAKKRVKEDPIPKEAPPIEAKFYLKGENGFLTELARLNTSQSVVLLEAKK